MHPAACNAEEQLLLWFSEVVQRVVKAAFWESENKLSSSLRKKEVQVVPVSTHSLSPFSHSVLGVVDLEVSEGLGRGSEELRDGQGWN